MAIDPRRFRRGRINESISPRKLLTIAAVAVAAQTLPRVASAQAQAPGNGGAPRDPWRFVSSIGVDETYSDNINLSPAGSERSDFVTSISPSISATRYGPRLTAVLQYSPQLLLYANGTNGTQFRNSLNATTNATIVENLLFFDASANISQQNISPFGTQAANTVNGSTNRAETRYYSFGPTLQSRYDRDLQYSAGYRYQQSNADSGAYATSHTNTEFAQFQSSTSFRDVGFGGSLNRSDQEYGGINEIVTESVNSNVTYVLQPTLHLQGNIGYDRNRYPTTGQADFQGVSYSGGFSWQPSHHTSVNAQVGHRYFGPTANISIQQTTAKFVVSATYVRDQTTSNASGISQIQDPNYALVDQFYRATITDPVLRQQAVTTALQQAGLSTSQFGNQGFLSNQLFVQKRADISVGLLGLHNTITFDANRTESQSLSAITAGFDIFNQASRFQTTSFSANLSHRLGPRMSVNFTAQKIHNNAIEGVGDTRQRQLVVSLNRQFQPKLSGTVLYRNTNQTSSNPTAGFYGGNYRENAILGSLRLNF